MCHAGTCGACDGETEVTCRCGAMEKEFKCSQLQQFTGKSLIFVFLIDVMLSW